MDAFLEITNGPFLARKLKLQTGERLSIGRSRQVELAIPHDRRLSLQHCELSFDGQTCHLRDLNSTNGTWHQNRRIKRTELLDGDSFTAGETAFHVLFAEQTEQAEELSEQNLSDFLKNRPSPLFALLDAARDEQVWEFLEPLPAEQYQCLFTGRQARTLAKYGPHLLKLDHDLLDRMPVNSWGESWGYFLEAPCEFEKLVEHLRQFLLVKDQTTGKERFFRFYDPRVLRRFLPICSAAQLAELFGPVQRFLSEDADPSVLLEFSFANRRLHRKTIPVRQDAPQTEDHEENQPEELSQEI